MKKQIIIILFFNILYSCNLKDTGNKILPDPGRRSYNFNPKVEIGQTWVSIDSLNPFRPIKYDTIKVIDMKGDYSKIIWNGDTTSMKTELVNWRGHLLK